MASYLGGIAISLFLDGDSLFGLNYFPVILSKFPVRLSREFEGFSPESRLVDYQNRENSLYIP
jgi:hypothetical protein